jgi:hypothetical protein
MLERTTPGSKSNGNFNNTSGGMRRSSLAEQVETAQELGNKRGSSSSMDILSEEDTSDIDHFD